MIGLGEVGIKAIIATRRGLATHFNQEPPVIGYLGIGFEEVQTESLFPGEYLRIRPASDRSQQRSIFIKESSAASYSLITDAINRISYAGIDEGTDWQLSLSARTNINLVYSLADIVGSGICIDVAFILRSILGEKANISMYCVTSGLSEPFCKRHAANVYATIQDLDYLYSVTNYEHPYVLNLPFESYQIQLPPMDSFYWVGSGENCPEELESVLIAVSFLSETIASMDSNIRQMIIEGSMDIEEKRAWISLARSSKVLLTTPFSLEGWEELLKKSANSIKNTIPIDEKGYNVRRYLYHPLIIAGPEDTIERIKNEPRLQGIFLSRIDFIEKQTKDTIIYQATGVYPAFQVIGWECELAYYSYEDHRSLHFEESIYDLMYASKFGLTPNVSITDDELCVYIKSRLFGFITQETSLDEAYNQRRELRGMIFRKEKEEPDNVDATYERLRHMSREEFALAFPCSDSIADAAYNYVTRIL